MANYTKENLIAVPPTSIPAGTLAIKIGDEILTAGNVKIGTDTSDATAVSGDILEGKTAYVNGEKITGSIARAETEWTEGVLNISKGYFESSIGVPVPDLTPDNIKTGAVVVGVEGTFTSDANATSSDIAEGKIAYVKGKKITGTATASGGGGAFYKCASVEGPQILSYISVSGAGITDCNGNYNDTGMFKENKPVYSYASTSGRTWYIYYTMDQYGDNYWVLSDRLDITYEAWYYGHYYSSNLTGTWSSGEGASNEPGDGPGTATVANEYNAINAGQAKTWSGYKLLVAENGYEVAEELTTGLVYGVGATSDYVNGCITPKVGGIYNSDCTAEICDTQFVTDDALTFTAEEPWSSVGLYAPYPGNVDVSGVMYSTDGKNWAAYPINTRIDLIKAGDFVKFINTKNVLTIKGSGASFSLTGKIAASGELKSMLNYADDWPACCFSSLFSKQNSLTSCPNISCNKLGPTALSNTFAGCQNIKKVKIRINELLPREDDGSYEGVNSTFSGCKSLAVVEVDINSWLGFDTYNGWLSGVSPKGVFIKPADLPEEYGEKRIPVGWQVVNK